MPTTPSKMQNEETLTHDGKPPDSDQHARIAVLGDDANIFLALQEACHVTGRCWAIELLPCSSKAVKNLFQQPPDLVLMAIGKAPALFLETLRRIKTLLPQSPVIVCIPRLDGEAVIPALMA